MLFKENLFYFFISPNNTSTWVDILDHLVADTVGLIHLICSIIALISGSLVLSLRKGTKTHKQVGYIYFLSMLLLLITALMIYRLFRGWGLFHYFTMVSLATLALGMIPVWFKKPPKKWLYRHFNFMYWSIMGLYSAAAAEVLTRIPESPFYGMIGYAIGFVMLIGTIVFQYKKRQWKREFNF